MIRSIILSLFLSVSLNVFAQGDLPRYKWEPLGPFEVPYCNVDSGEWTPSGIGWIESLAIAGRRDKVMYAGSNVGGLFVSTNRGKKWKFRFDVDRICGIWDIVVDDKNSRKLWVATGTNTWDYPWGHGVLYSKNRGKSWRPTGLSFAPHEKQVVYGLKRSQLNPDMFVACTETDVYISHDKTETWKRVLDNPDKARVNFRHLILHNGDVDRMVVSGSGLYTSINGGETWEEHSQKLTFQKEKNNRDSLPTRYAIAVNPKNNNEIVVVYSYRRMNYIDRSDDFGKTWYNVLRNRDFDRVEITHAEIAWSPVDTNFLLVGSVRVYMSNDQGKTFNLGSEPRKGSPRFMHDDIRSMHFDKNGVIWVGHDGGVSKSEDHCASWVDLNGKGLQATQFYDIAVDSGRLVGGCQDLSSMIYQNGEWEQTCLVYGDGGMNLIHGNEVYIMQNGMRIRKGSFANDGWDLIYTPYSPKRFYYPFLFSPINGRLWATDHDLWEMDEKGRWFNLTIDVPHGMTKIVALDASDPEKKVVYIAKDQPTWDPMPEGLKNRFYKGFLTDSGYNWKDITANLSILAWREITSIASNPTDNSEVYVSLYGFDENEKQYRVFRSLDGGETWNNWSDGLPNLNAFKILPYNQGEHILLATDQGVYYRKKDGTAWVQMIKGMPAAHIMDLEIDESVNRLYAATFGNGIWTMELPAEWSK